MNHKATLYHGSGESIAPGARLRPRRDRYNYLAATESWADAFAFRDAASRAVGAAVEQAILAPAGPDLSILHSGVSRVTGYIYAVEVEGTIQRDPDFLACTDSLRASGPVTVVSSAQQGTVRSWREFTSIVGPYQKWIENQLAFDVDGYLQPPPLWESWGYTRQVLRALGPWYPFKAVWEDTTNHTLKLVSEFSVPFWELPRSRHRNQLLERLNAYVTFTPETAEVARTSWWQ